MRIDVRGWSRNMGSSNICKIDLEKANKLRDDDQAELAWGKPNINIKDDETIISCSARLQKSGEYRLDIALPDEDLGCIVRANYGKELNVAAMEALGVTVSKDVIAQALSEMSFKDVISLIKE